MTGCIVRSYIDFIIDGFIKDFMRRNTAIFPEICRHNSSHCISHDKVLSIKSPRYLVQFVSFTWTLLISIFRLLSRIWVFFPMSITLDFSVFTASRVLSYHGMTLSMAICNLDWISEIFWPLEYIIVPSANILHCSFLLCWGKSFT